MAKIVTRGRGIAAAAHAVIVAVGVLIAARSATAADLVSNGGSQTEVLTLIDGDDIRFSRLSAQGLSQTRVSHIVQDDRGFMWFGTQYGLDRYDGYTYKVFVHDPAQDRSLGCVYIRALFKDRSGTLWVGCDQFLDRYDAATETFTHYRLGHRRADEPPVHIFSINQDRANMIWLSTDDGLYAFETASERMTRYAHDDGDALTLGSNDVKMTGEDRDGRFWVSDGGQVEEFDRQRGRVLRRIRVIESGRRPVLFLEDHAGVFWIMYMREGEESGLAVLDRSTNRLTRYTIRERDSGRPVTAGIYSAVEDQGQTLWFATYGSGVLKFDRDRRLLVRYRNYPSDVESLADDRVIALATDREGNVWTGLHAMPPNVFRGRPSFLPLLRNAEHPDSFGEAFINAVYEDSRGTLWTSTTGALVRVDRGAGRHAFYRPPGPGLDHDIIAITEDRSGAMWVGTVGAGLNRFDAATGAFTTYRHNPADPSSLSDDVVSRLLVDRRGTLWATTWNGLDRFDPRTNRFIVYKQDVAGIPERFWNIVEAPDGALWLGGTAGLHRFDPDTGSFTVYGHVPEDVKTLSDNTVTSVLIDHAGTVWASTENGLNRFDRATQTFTSFRAKDGLPGDAVSCVLEDVSGRLWMSTTHGLSRFDPATRTFRNYSTADGVPAGDLTGWDACFKSRSGEMFFGGFSGGVAFRPDSIVDRSYAPPVVLTDIQIAGKPVAPGVGSPFSTSITYADRIALTHEQNVFALTFVALSYLNPAANRYRYRLDGLDREWVEVGSDRRTATYTTLPPGRYTFRAQVETRPGVWSEPGVVFGVAILPPWWATPWFRTLAALAFAASLWALYVFRIRRASATIRARMEERVVERERIAREWHDTLLQGVQGLILRFQAAAERIPPTEPTREMLETALDRADEMMTQARDRVTNLRVALDTVRSLPDELADALADRARNAGADLAIVVEGERRAVNPLVREEAYWIGHEAIVNAARHARATRIEVEIGYGPKEWRLRVRDDGCGIDLAVLECGGKPNHWGMRGMRERASRIGGRLDTWSRPGAGTEIELRVDGAVAYQRDTPRRDEARSSRGAAL